MGKLPVAAQIYTVRGEAERDFLSVVKEIKEIGYDGVELAGLYHYTASEIKAMLSEAGLKPISAHVPLQEWISDTDGTADTYKGIGCEYVAVPYLPDEWRPGTPKFPETLEWIRKIGRACNERGMRLMYHNHDFEFITLPSGRYGLDEIYAEIPEELLQTEIDTCWVKVSGVEPAGYIRKYAGRSPVVHLKDYVGQKSGNMYNLIGLKPNEKTDSTAFQFRAVGDGCQDWKSILQACLDAGSKWVVVEQDEHYSYTPMEDMRRSLGYLRSLGW